MTNIIKSIYDGIENMISTHMNDYIDELDTNHRMPEIEHIFREYVDIYELPSYPSIVFGYGEISFDDEHPTTREHWNVPVSIYAVMSGADTDLVHKICEAYEFLLFSIFNGEDNDLGIITVTGMGVSPAMKRQNQLIQVGYVDININVSVERKQI